MLPGLHFGAACTHFDWLICFRIYRHYLCCICSKDNECGCRSIPSNTVYMCLCNRRTKEIRLQLLVFSHLCICTTVTQFSMFLDR